MSESLFSSSDGIDPAVVEAARVELAARLPELRELPGFPIGSDKDILKMSVPPYYTACPNPFVEEWLEASAPDGYEDREYVDPGPFASDVSAGKRHPAYQAHSYWTKVPHEMIMRYILHYTEPGDVVLDGFAGTGMTGVAARACKDPEPKIKAAIEAEMDSVKWGPRRVVMQDLSPPASVIAAGLNLPVDADEFEKASAEILQRFDSEMGWMYQTTHVDGSPAPIDFVVWSEAMSCPNCAHRILYFLGAFDDTTDKFVDDFACDSCGTAVSKQSLIRRKVMKPDLVSGELSEVPEREAVRIYYRAQGSEHWKAPDDHDRDVLRRVDASGVLGIEHGRLPYMHLTHERNDLEASGVVQFGDFWYERSRIALNWAWQQVATIENPILQLALQFWIDQAFWGMSRMVVFSRQVFSMVNQYRKGYYYLPPVGGEVSFGYYLGRRRKSYLRALTALGDGGSFRLSVASSEAVLIGDSSVDYIFVDPPFGENIYYADLDYLSEPWYGVGTNRSEEATIDRNSRDPRSLEDYASAIGACFAEFFRVLKPGRWMTTEFSNHSNRVWLAIQEALAGAGFVVADTRVLDKQLLSYRQVTAKSAVKQDLVISAYKPSGEIAERFSLVAGAPDGAWEFVSEHLSHLPVVEGRRGESGSVRERFADRLYDRMVAYHVHRSVSVPLTAAEFYSGMERRFPVRDDMYFLPEQVEEYERHRMTFKELAQLEMFITGEASAVQWLRQLLKKKPRTYAQIQPLFFDELQAGLPDWEELPELRGLLEESFLQDDQDRWFVPDPKKSVDLEAQRTKGLLREFETYVSGKGKLSSFRSEAVRAGFKDAWGRRDFAVITAVGERLPADAFVEDEALLYYYDNARRLLPEAK